MHCCKLLLLLAAAVAHAQKNGNATYGNDQTSITDSLNSQIVPGKLVGKGTFQGGKGIIVRTPDFFSGTGNVVVPGTFWVNDIVAPNTLYPAGNPWCPHSGTDGFENIGWSQCDFPNGPWSYATVASVLGVDGMQKLFKDFDNIQDPKWGWGVFYAYDANAGDKRCRNLASQNGFDCPQTWVPYQGQPHVDYSKKGAGFYQPGNPYAGGGGGGAGCHFDSNKKVIDQTDATDWHGNNLVQDSDCQCNYAFNKDWGKWVDDWMDHTKQKPGFEWRNWLAGGNGRAPAWGLDTAICWVNNPRDMIEMQNALWSAHSRWLNGVAPKWSQQNPSPYWGWNEVPIDRTIADDPKWWDAVMIKLPAGLNSVNELGGAEKFQLEKDLASWEKNGKIVPGSANCATRPGSYMVFVREVTFHQDAYYRKFYCENWKSPSGWYQVVYEQPPPGKSGGACYIDKPKAATSQSSVMV